MTVTYWLYTGTRCVGSVRMQYGATDDEVRARALAQHRATPLPFDGFTPAEFEQLLATARVRR